MKRLYRNFSKLTPPVGWIRTLMLRHPFLALVFGATTLLPAPTNAARTNVPSSLPVSPVANWEPSWAASSAHGTTVAVKFGSGEGCVVLLRSSSAAAPVAPITTTEDPLASLIPTRTHRSSNKGDSGSGNGTIRVGPFNLPLWMEHDDSNSPEADNAAYHYYSSSNSDGASSRVASDRGSKRWAWLGSDVLTFWTGLASDVDHAVAVLQHRWDNHRLIYEAAPDHPLGTGMAVRTVATLLSAAAQVSHGRPYGIQCLVVGLAPYPPPPLHPAFNRLTASSSPVLQFVTLDPGGGYRHWGAATAIGRGADRVRRHLHAQLLQQQQQQRTSVDDNNKGQDFGARDALRVALNATRLAWPDDGEASPCTAIVVWGQRGRSRGARPVLRAATVDPSAVDNLRRELEEGDCNRSAILSGALEASYNNDEPAIQP